MKQSGTVQITESLTKTVTMTPNERRETQYEGKKSYSQRGRYAATFTKRKQITFK